MGLHDCHHCGKHIFDALEMTDHVYEMHLKENALEPPKPMEQIKKIEKQLTNIIIDNYEPESTKWNRNYSDRAEWYYVWNKRIEKT